MFEARLIEGNVLKKLIESMKDLVQEANFDCSSTGISLQAMDTSHVSLVALQLREDGFEHFRCDRNMSLGTCTVPCTVPPLSFLLFFFFVFLVHGCLMF